jgi:hypothetical protein
MAIKGPKVVTYVYELKDGEVRVCVLEYVQTRLGCVVGRSM